MELHKTQRRALTYAARALVGDCFTQDPADRSGGEEGCAKRFVACERIGNFEDADFDEIPKCLCAFACGIDS